MRFLYYLSDNKYIKVLIICIVLDTIFGILRAIREKKVNSNIGIDGIIRKVGMIISIIFFMGLDYILELNFIAFIPTEIKEFIGIDKIGVTSLFNVLFIIFESLSILKNMIKCKLPIPKKFQKWLEDVFNKYTKELESEDKEK